MIGEVSLPPKRWWDLISILFALLMSFSLCYTAQGQHPGESADPYSPAEDTTEVQLEPIELLVQPESGHTGDATSGQTGDARSEEPVGEMIYIIHNQDTTYALHNPEMDSLVVTGSSVDATPVELQRSRRTLSQNNPLHRLVTQSELTSAVSRLTADLQRDLPSMIRFYTPQGIPMLIKYTSNNSLTTTLPNSSIGFNILEPGARYPSPDAPIIITPEFEGVSRLSFTPFKQTLGHSSAPGGALSAGFGHEHSGAPNPLEKVVPELETFSTTYMLFGTGRARFGESWLEAMAHHSLSDNEFGGLLGVDQLYEEESNTFANLHGHLSLGSDFHIHGGFTHQAADIYRDVVEQDHAFVTTHDLLNTTWTAAVGHGETVLRATWHDLIRTYNGNRFDLSRLESSFTHLQKFGSDLHARVETRFDHRDEEVSVSGQLKLFSDRPLSITLNAAHLYDAIGSEAISSSFRNAQIEPHAWTTRYARAGVIYKYRDLTFESSLMNKHVELGWYEHTGTIDGWVARTRIQGLHSGAMYVAWQVEGVARTLQLENPDEGVQFLPGPARYEGRASVEVGTERVQFVIRGDTFIDRRQIIRVRWTEEIGNQYFLSTGVSANLGAVQLGFSLDNILSIFGSENVMAAYNVGDEARFASAPPVPSISVDIEF